MSRKYQKVRYELSMELARYLLYHLREELKKDKDIIDFDTILGVPFQTTIESTIKEVKETFPDLIESNPSFNFMKEWWKIVTKNKEIFPDPKPYNKTTFTSQNRIFLFKIFDIKDQSPALRKKFDAEMGHTIRKMREKGKSVSFEMIFHGETVMYPILENIVKRTKLPPNICRKILFEQNSFIQSIAYKVIDNEIRYSLKKSDEILKSILPDSIAEEVKWKGKVTPKSYPNASILFCDLAGFTEISSKLTPELLLEELDECFSHLDKITNMHNLEKIKTIGDSYMAASGLSFANQDLPAVNAVLCGLRIQEFMRKYYLSQNRKDLPAWKIRIGIHSGPVVAGVLGEQRFNYDIWGDSVNTAQRMEANGLASQVNISKATYELTKDFFDFEIRGPIEVKGKGSLEMFFVKGIKPELSLNDGGRTPNKAFRKMYESFLTSSLDKNSPFLKGE